MAKELVISSNRHETKVALIEDEQLVEIHFQRANEYSLAGSIHKGRVTRVLPGMQSAFVDIGLERDAFLYVSDFLEETEEYDRIPVSVPGRRPSEERPAEAEKASAVKVEPEAEWRDRRLRRSRRRRPRGHGFPESKYATETEAAESRKPTPESAGEFAILPGESLAKYRDLIPDQGGRQDGGECERVADVAAEGDVEAPAVEEPVMEGSGGLERAAGSADWAPAVQERPDTEGAARTQEAGLPEQPLSEFNSGPEVGEFKEAEPEASGDATEYDAAASAAGDSALEEPGPMETEGDRYAAQEGFEGGASSAAQEAAEAAAPEIEGAEDSQGEGAGEEIEPARMPVSLTATLREQGLRFLHRTPRRMRRKMRGPRAEEGERTVTEAPGAAKAEPAAAEEREEKPAQPSIAELLREGQEILVQIAKEPLGQKGARITSHITLPGRYVVYMPTVEHYGVSRKIASDEERLRLKRILHRRRMGMPGGFIVRTAGAGKSEEEIATDMQQLYNLWLSIRKKAEARKAPALIHHDLDLVTRTLRDELTEDFKAIWTDSEEVYESVLNFVERFQPTLVNRVKLYTRPTPIFDAFNISQELEKALRPKVWLKSGGYIVINQTEALVAIDVNTGKFVGKSNRLEDTIFRTNTEAVKEIVRQIRLRDLGGIIVIDFIDMDERKNRQRVMQALEEAMRADRAPYKVLQFNDFGLVAITRKRVKQSLERELCSPCPYCEGSGYVKSVQTVIGEILQEAHRIAAAVEGREVMLRVNPEVAKVLKSARNDYLEELEEILRRPVLVSSDATLQQEKFDLA